jgi:hypothetical protein
MYSRRSVRKSAPRAKRLSLAFFTGGDAHALEVIAKADALLVTKRKSPPIAARPARRSHRYDRAMPHGDGPKVTRMGAAEGFIP